MAWIDKQPNETAANLKTRLETAGARVKISETPTFSVLCSDAVSPLKQILLATVWEYRGLTEAAATKLRELTADDTTTTTYYATRRSNGAVIAYEGKNGTAVEVSASRADESGQWVARYTQSSYSVGLGRQGEGTAVWSSTALGGSSNTTTTTSITTRVNLLSYGYGDTIVGYVRQKVVTTVVEYTCVFNLTSYNNQAADNTSIASVTYSNDQSETLTFQYKVGSIVSIESRYVDALHGYTVIKTTQVWSTVP